MATGFLSFDRYRMTYNDMQNKLNKPIQNSITIPINGWIENTNSIIYKKCITLNVENIKNTDIVDGNISPDTIIIAQDCNFATYNNTGDGTITFYAEEVPSSPIVFYYYTIETKV